MQVSTSFLGLFGTGVGLLVESGRLFGDSRSNLNRPCGVSGSKLNQPRRSLSSLKLAEIILRLIKPAVTTLLWNKETLPNGLSLILEHPAHGRRRTAERDVAPVLVTNALHPLQR